jgi:serine protease Do
MTSESAERVQCPSCAESIAAEARICPHCRQSALVDVVVEQVVTDARLRYQLARQIASWGPPYPALLDAQERLVAQRPVIAQGLTALEARRALELIERQGLAGRLVASGPRAQAHPGAPVGGGLSPRMLAAAAALLVVIAGAVLAAFVLRHGRTASGQGGAAPSLEASVTRTLTTEELAAAILPSTVAVHCGAFLGAGFFVAEDTILTNAHVLPEGCQPISVDLADGRVGTGRRARVAEDVDLALISVSDLGAKPLVLGDAGDTKVGERVLLVGSPKGFEFSVHEGLVSSVSRSGLGTAYLQLDAKINPGNSGGPVVNMRGQVVGVVTLKQADAEGIGFALPVNYAFTGAEPLVAPPAAVDPGRFEAMLGRVSGQEKEQAAQIESAFKSYALLKGALRVVSSQYGSHREFVLTVGRIGSKPFMPETHRIHVRLGGTRVCSVAVEVGEWEAVEGANLSSLVDPKMAQWLAKQNVDVGLFVGKGIMPRPPCPEVPEGSSTYILELEGADPGYSRLAAN